MGVQRELSTAQEIYPATKSKVLHSSMQAIFQITLYAECLHWTFSLSTTQPRLVTSPANSSPIHLKAGARLVTSLATVSK